MTKNPTSDFLSRVTPREINDCWVKKKLSGLIRCATTEFFYLGQVFTMFENHSKSLILQTEFFSSIIELRSTIKLCVSNFWVPKMRSFLVDFKYCEFLPFSKKRNDTSQLPQICRIVDNKHVMWLRWLRKKSAEQHFPIDLKRWM